MILIYVCILVCAIIIILVLMHVLAWRTVNYDMKILQTSHGAPALIYDLLLKHSPMIYQNEIEQWDDAYILIDQSLLDIKEIIATYPNISNIIKQNLALNNKPFTYDWNINIKPILNGPNAHIYMTYEKNYLELVVCITGIVKIVLLKPFINHILELKYLGKMNNCVSTIDITPLLNIEPLQSSQHDEFEFIEVVLRSGNMIYIPYKWYYYIYNVTVPIPTIDINTNVNTNNDNNENNENNLGECVIMHCINKSIIDIF